MRKLGGGWKKEIWRRQLKVLSCLHKNKPSEQGQLNIILTERTSSPFAMWRTVAHLVCECKYLAHTKYKKWRHDKVAQVIHWQLCKTYNDLEHAYKWYMVKWLAHCVRMENDALQKLSLFMTTTKKNYESAWSRIESRLGMDGQQFWKLARDKPSFNRYINSRYGSFEDESSTWSTKMCVCMYVCIAHKWRLKIWKWKSSGRRRFKQIRSWSTPDQI